MKTVLSILNHQFKPDKKPISCTHIMAPSGPLKLETSVLATEYRCSYCNGIEHHCPFVDPSISNERAWLCDNGDCDVYTKILRLPTTIIQPIKRFGLQWPLFCEINGIGDEHHSVKFDSVHQSKGKIDYLTRFCEKPKGIIVMEGEKGTGKTFAAMAACELFTRTNSSCIFTTHQKMAMDWLDTFREKNRYIQSIINCNLLVIDDLGTGEIPPKFMIFFMDLIDKRMQWTDRGTIITTNLNEKELAVLCKESLFDRLNTGQQFKFQGKSRRKQNVL